MLFDELDLSLARLLPPARLHNADRAALLLADAIAQHKKLLIMPDIEGLIHGWANKDILLRYTAA